MAEAAKRRSSYQDLLAYPAGTNVELIDGQILALPRPSTPHITGASTLGFLLMGPFQFGRGGPGGWVILDQPELHLASDAIIPDLAGWRRERMPQIPRAPAIELVPDWVCEFLSNDSTAARDRAIKMPLYAARGVRHLWLADTEAHTVEIYRLIDKGWLAVRTFSGDDAIRAEPFEAIELELGLLWRR